MLARYNLRGQEASDKTDAFFFWLDNPARRSASPKGADRIVEVRDRVESEQSQIIGPGPNYIDARVVNNAENGKKLFIGKLKRRADHNRYWGSRCKYRNRLFIACCEKVCKAALNSIAK